MLVCVEGRMVWSYSIHVVIKIFVYKTSSQSTPFSHNGFTFTFFIQVEESARPAGGLQCLPTEVH